MFIGVSGVRFRESGVGLCVDASYRSSGDLTGSDSVLWTLNRGTPYVPSPLLMDGLLYFCQRNDAILTCVEAATGEVGYSQERLEGLAGNDSLVGGSGGRGSSSLGSGLGGVSCGLPIGCSGSAGSPE